MLYAPLIFNIFYVSSNKLTINDIHIKIIILNIL